ncbi:hypothetical protein KBY58_12160 [Cyanobium sp. HWJ4-Hawea]|nr:hypothetical protein [Cyanobium sp. HWJ4-Hawea]
MTNAATLTTPDTDGKDHGVLNASSYRPYISYFILMDLFNRQQELMIGSKLKQGKSSMGQNLEVLQCRIKLTVNIGIHENIEL